jgi:hypothetical protein
MQVERANPDHGRLIRYIEGWEGGGPTGVRILSHLKPQFTLGLYGNLSVSVSLETPGGNNTVPVTVENVLVVRDNVPEITSFGFNANGRNSQR